MYTIHKYSVGILRKLNLLIPLFCLLLYQLPSYSLTSSENISKLEKEEEYDEVIDEGIPLLKHPELIYSTDVHYPIDISRQGIEGSVLLDMIIDESGKVENVSIARGIHPTLDTLALKASENYIFTPAIDEDSSNIPVLIQYEILFSLQDVIIDIDEFVNLSGRIIERGTRKPIKEAKVILKPIKFLPDTALPVPAYVYFQRIGKIKGQYIEKNSIITTTDSNGIFSFYNIPSCSLQISVISLDYDLFKVSTVINFNKNKNHNIYLRKAIPNGYEVQVYGKKDKKEISHSTLHVNEINKVPGLAGDAIKVVQTLPGVARPMFSSGELIIRGGANSDNRYFMDGVRIPKL
ncbi:MAG: TonB family protein, partial [Chitinispirillia bacterium]